jgi:hypothetical protein
MVQQLVAQQQQTQSAVADTQAQVTEVKTAQAQAQAPAAVPAGKQPIQATAINASGNPGTAFSYGGFIKLDAMATDTSDGRIADGSAGRLFYLPSTIPVGDDGADGGDPYTDVHAQFSRFWFSADTVTDGGDEVKAALTAAGYPEKADPERIDTPMVIVLLAILVIYVTMVYGPIAAWLVELFPTRIRYTSMSLPYHIGNGWFGGFLPTISFALVAASGNIYQGLWYPIVNAVMTLVFGTLFLP